MPTHTHLPYNHAHAHATYAKGGAQTTNIPFASSSALRLSPKRNRTSKHSRAPQAQPRAAFRHARPTTATSGSSAYFRSTAMQSSAAYPFAEHHAVASAAREKLSPERIT